MYSSSLSHAFQLTNEIRTTVTVTIIVTCFLDLTGRMLSSRLSRTSLDLDLDLGELIVIITGKAEAFICW